MIEELSRPEVVDFMLRHENDDPRALVLARSKYPEIPVQLAVAQIQSRKKAKTKLPEWHAAQGVLFPHSVSLEQCSSEATAKYKTGLARGSRLIDLTGGTGIDTCYLSENFEQTTYVEQSEELCQLARHNFNALQSKIDVWNGSAEDFIKLGRKATDWYYIDPARRDSHDHKVFQISDCSPDVIKLQERLFTKAENILIKFSPLLDITQVGRSLQHVSDIHVVSVDNECKELLVVLKKGWTGTYTIHTVNIQKKEIQNFSFKEAEEAGAEPEFSMPQAYLYEPNSSVLKSGAFKIISQEFGLKKLHPNSHLYTSEKKVDGFPGRSFSVLGVEALKKASLKSYLKEGKANIACRNFPLSVNQIRKKTGIKEGGDTFIFATTLISNKPALIICRKEIS
ncbi:MAG: class I SAM-dependent methyltransferase [Cyclobacteriaceae bacterium]